MAKITITIDDVDYPDHDDARPWTAYIAESDVETIDNYEAGLGATPQEALVALVHNEINWRDE